MGTPESNFWKLIKKNLPKKCHSTRIESRLPSGVPDCHFAWDGLVFWLELKTTKNNTLRISPNQISWNSAYCLRGGFSFYLAKHTKTKDIYLFGGDQVRASWIMVCVPRLCIKVQVSRISLRLCVLIWNRLCDSASLYQYGLSK